MLLCCFEQSPSVFASGVLRGKSRGRRTTGSAHPRHLQPPPDRGKLRSTRMTASRRMSRQASALTSLKAPAVPSSWSSIARLSWRAHLERPARSQATSHPMDHPDYSSLFSHRAPPIRLYDCPLKPHARPNTSSSVCLHARLMLLSSRPGSSAQPVSNSKARTSFGRTHSPSSCCKPDQTDALIALDRKSTRLNSSHSGESRMPSSA